MTQKEAPKLTPKQTLPEIMEKYGAMFSIEIPDGFAHLKFTNGKMRVTWLVDNDEGYVDEDGQEIAFESIERVADFMREMKEMRLDEYKKQ